MTRSPNECHPLPDLKAGDEVSFVNAEQVTQDETHRIQNGARSAFPPVMRAPIARSKWENPWNPTSSAGRLAESKRKNVVKSRGTDADHMHGFDRFLWRNKEDATLSEVIGRESWIQALDRDELIQQLLALGSENRILKDESRQLRHDMYLMTEALRQVVEEHETVGESAKSEQNLTVFARSSHHILTGSQTLAGPARRESVLLAKQLHWREKALITFKKKWDGRMLSSVLHKWLPWANARGEFRRRLQRFFRYSRHHKLSDAWRSWVAIAKSVRWTGIKSNLRGDELERTAILMMNTRIRHSIRSILIGWRAVAVCQLERRGRSTAMKVAAEAEVEAIAATAELRVLAEQLAFERLKARRILE